MAKKIALLTGGTDGIGRIAAPQLAAMGYFMIVQGRNPGRGKAVIDEIDAAGGKGVFKPCNFASVADVRRFADEISEEYDHLDLLINNAGIGVGAGGDDNTEREESDDGYERRFAVNYLAPYVLTRLLLGKVRAGAPARIVNLASEGQEPLDFDNMQLTTGYTGYWGYCRSKVAVLMMTLDLAEELKDDGILVNAMHPGAFMDTGMVREMGHEVVDSAEDGARYMIELATDSRFEGVTGRYICQGEDKRAKEQVYDPTARKQLREYTRSLVGL